jgi:hypothetical protein
MYVMKNEVKKRFPEVSRHFKGQDVQLIACFSQYFITIFLYDTPISIGLRIFDVFLLEGEKVLFELIYKMIGLKKNKILELTSQDLFVYLRKRMIKECFEEYNLSTLFSAHRQEDLELSEMN